MLELVLLVIAIGAVAALAVAFVRERTRGERLVRDALEALPEGVAFYGQSGTLQLWNHAYEANAFATAKNALVRGARFRELLREDVQAGRYPAAIGREESWLDEEMRLRSRGDGFREHALSDGRRIKVSDRRAAHGGIVSICHDMTEQMEADALSAQSRIRYRAMASEASDIIVLREAGRIVLASQALGRILGRSPEEFDDGGYLNLVHPDDLDEALKLRGRPPPGEIWAATYRLPHVEGHYIWFEAHTRGIYDEATGEFLREISVLREITERKKQEQALRAALEKSEAASRAKSLFLATASHELRTPLNAILGFSEILKEETLEPGSGARRRDYAQSIHDSGGHLLALISDILDISKLDNGRLELSREAVELEPLLAECAGRIARQAEKSGLGIRTSFEAGPCRLNADRKRLSQIVLNLLSNALKFTPHGGEICLASSRRDDGIMLTVSDTGIGMEAEAIPRALERFGQLDSSLARRYEGMGLGLPITRQLVELHGWTLAIESKIDAGTKVTLFISAEQILAERCAA